MYGLAHGRQAVAWLERAGEHWWLGQSWFQIGIFHFLMGRFDEALEAATHIRTAAEELDDPRLSAYGEAVRGLALVTRGDSVAGVAACQRALALAPDPLSLGGCQFYLGCAYLEAGRPAEARPLLTEVVERMKAMGLRRIWGRALAWLGEACRLSGEPDRAGALARESRAIAEAIGSRYACAWADRLLRRLARDAGDRGAARQHLERALAGFRDSDAIFEAGRTDLDLGKLAQFEGDHSQARVHFARAREAFVASAAPRYVESVASSS